MIPYVIINGESSKNVHGLLIQSLPPITKPKMRTSKEEIDGRSGDLVKTLGYAAYDKTMTIGLKGDYNVDDVIKYFDTSGKITFSNEIDKYYNFACYESIDFEKLIRFKTANVKFHVQPFKYSVDDPPVRVAGQRGSTILNLTALNNGNTTSRPTLTIKGWGDINVYIRETQILNITLYNQGGTEGETIIIDTEEMNALSPEGEYMNRRVTGDYDNLTFPTGQNTITITGTLNYAQLEKYSRWI